MANDFQEVVAEIKSGNIAKAKKDADAVEKQQLAADKALKAYNEGTQKLNDKLAAVKKELEEGKISKKAYKEQVKSIKEDKRINAENEKFRIEQLSADKLEREEEQAYRATDAGELKTRGEDLAKVREELEKGGAIAEKNEDYLKMQSQLAKDTFQLAFKQSSKSQQKEMLKEQFKKDRKQLTILQQIKGGIGVLGDNFREKLDKGGGFMSFLKTGALIGLLFALPKILNSQAAKDIVKFIEEKVIPFFGKLKDFLVNTLGEDGALVLGLVGLAALVAPATTFTAAKVAIASVTSLVTGIGAAFTFISAKLAIVTGVLGTIGLVGAGTILGLIALVVSLAYGLYEGIKAFKDKFAETGNIFESAKTAFATFLGEALGLIPNLILDLTGYIAGLFGFDKFKEKIQAIDVGKFFTDAFLDLFDKVSFWIRALYLKIKPVLDKVGDFLQPAVDTVKSIANFIMKLLSPFKVVIDKAKAIFKKIGGAIGDLFSTSDEERQEQIAMEKRNIEMMREQDEQLGKDANKFAIERAQQRISKIQSEMGPDLDTNVEAAKLEELPQTEIVKPVEREPVTVANALPAEAPMIVSNNQSSSNTNNYASYGVRVTANDTSTMHIVNQN